MHQETDRIKHLSFLISTGNQFSEDLFMLNEKIRKSLFFCVLSTSTLSSAFVFADDADAARLGLGINYSVNYQVYHGDDVNHSILPVIFYDNKKVYIEGSEAGVYLVNNDNNELRLNAYYDGSEFDPAGKVRALNKRDWSIMAGVSYMRITPYGGFKAQIGTDVLSRSKGTVASLAYLAELNTGKWSIYPELGMQWNDSKYNQYYYGVSAEEAERSHLKEYHLDQSVQPYASLNVNYKVTRDWNAFAGLDLTYLSDTQSKSPMVNRRLDITPSIGIMHRF